MNKKVLYIPLDERPCNYVYPQAIAAIAGMDLTVAPERLLGKFKQAAPVDALWDWLFENASEAGYAVISLDMLYYGGIVPSRLHQLTEKCCLERAQRLTELKKRFPSLTVFAFQLITRAPARNGSGEEPDYYEAHGYDISRYGALCDKEQCGVATEEDRAEKEQIPARVPASDLADFLRRREINFKMNLRSIESAKQGIIDHLVIPLDDCAQYGYAPSERRRLAAFAAEQGMLSKTAMYPGADEMGCTLMARALCAIEGYSPRIQTNYSSNTGILTIPQYEDRTIGETVPQHIRCAGARLAGNGEPADIALMVNPPTAFSNRIKFELDRRKIHMETERNLPLFIERIEGCLSSNLVCAIADCAVPDGADQCLMQFLRENNLLGRIDVFGGWNTSSNTLGTVIAQAVALFFARKSGRQAAEAQRLSEKFRFARYIEDWGYMTHVRQNISERVAAGYYGKEISVRYLGNKAETVAADITRELADFAGNVFGNTPRRIRATLPWARMFEIALTLE